jgi:hypothetical protein
MNTNKFLSILGMANHAKRKNNYAYLDQVKDIIALKTTNPTCGISDYYWYKMYDRRVCPRSAYKDYLGWRAQQAFSLSMNSRSAVTPAWDKLTFFVVATAYGLPTPSIRALFSPQRACPQHIEIVMSTVEEVRAHFKNAENFPVFMKPSFSQQGFGGHYLIGYEKEQDQVLTQGGNRIPFDTFMAQTINYPKRAYYRREAGYLFQSIASQHRDITLFTGTDVPSGLRVVTINEEEGPRIHRALWKIVTPPNTNDNFSKGKYGNLVSKIDLGDGQAAAAVDKFWPEANWLHTHPATGHRFRDFKIPLWSEVLACVLEASAVFGMMKVLHWDIVVSNDGPVILELNDVGATEFLQLHGQGLLDEALKKAMRHYADLSANKALRRLVMNPR